MLVDNESSNELTGGGFNHYEEVMIIGRGGDGEDRFYARSNS